MHLKNGKSQKSQKSKNPKKKNNNKKNKKNIILVLPFEDISIQPEQSSPVHPVLELQGFTTNVTERRRRGGQDRFLIGFGGGSDELCTAGKATPFHRRQWVTLGKTTGVTLEKKLFLSTLLGSLGKCIYLLHTTSTL